MCRTAPVFEAPVRWVFCYMRTPRALSDVSATRTIRILEGALSDRPALVTLFWEDGSTHLQAGNAGESPVAPENKDLGHCEILPLRLQPHSALLAPPAPQDPSAQRLRDPNSLNSLHTAPLLSGFLSPLGLPLPLQVIANSLSSTPPPVGRFPRDQSSGCPP